MRELRHRASGRRYFGTMTRWTRILAAAALGLATAACDYESADVLHRPSDVVRPPHLIGSAWVGDCQRFGEGEACLFPIEGHPEWLTVRLSGENRYSYYALPRRQLASMPRGADGAGVLLHPRGKQVFVARRDLDIALGNLIVMFEAMERLPAAERCRVTVDALPFHRPQSWACE